MNIPTVLLWVQLGLDVVGALAILVTMKKAHDTGDTASRLWLRFLHVDGCDMASCAQCGSIGLQGRMKKVVVEGDRGNTSKFYCGLHSPSWDIEKRIPTVGGETLKYYKLNEVQPPTK